MLTLNKTELAGALAALGKLVCRTSPIPVYRAVQIEATDNMLLFRTHSVTEEIEFRMDVETAETFKTVVDFDFFRSLVKNCRNKNISFEFDDGKLHIGIPSMENTKVKMEPFRWSAIIILPSPRTAVLKLTWTVISAHGSAVCTG